MKVNLIHIIINCIHKQFQRLKIFNDFLLNDLALAVTYINFYWTKTLFWFNKFVCNAILLTNI